MASPDLLAPHTPTPKRPQRSRSSLAVAATPSPSGLNPAHSPLPDEGTDPPSSRSSLRSGRPYLPKDTGIPPGRGRRLFPPTASSSNTCTPSQKSSGVAARTHPSLSPIQSSQKGHSSPLDSSHHNQTPSEDHALDQPFSLPPDHEQWAKTYMGSPAPPPPSTRQQESTIPQPPQAATSPFFRTWFSRTLESHVSGFRSPDLVSEAVPIGPIEPGAHTAPRSTTLVSNNPLDPITETNMTPATAAYHHFANQMTREYAVRRPSTKLCIAADCPLVGIRHFQGVYVHNNVPAPNPLRSVFGMSNPPPGVWQAILKGTLEQGTRDDAKMISGFIRHHVVAARFSVVPDGNFAWGDEDVFQAEGGVSPVVELPVMALPLRVKFDVLPNLPVALHAGDSDDLGDHRVRGISDMRVSTVKGSANEKKGQGTVDPRMLLETN
ncbi:MAG: hypothetical protein Q9200_001620 [Gallowayella weberi]